MVRPGLRWLAGVYQKQGRLTPTVLATVLALLLLSGYATDWMGIKFIFGAFIFGIIMPRNVPALREAILERLEQVSVIVLLPVFFVIAGLSVNLSSARAVRARRPGPDHGGRGDRQVRRCLLWRETDRRA